MGITTEQAERLMDRVKQFALSVGIIRYRATEKHDPIMEQTAYLLEAQGNSLYNDMLGMVNGNGGSK